MPAEVKPRIFRRSMTIPSLPGITVPTRASGYFAPNATLGAPQTTSSSVPDPSSTRLNESRVSGMRSVCTTCPTTNGARSPRSASMPSRVATCVLSSWPISAAVRSCGTKARSQSWETIMAWAS